MSWLLSYQRILALFCRHTVAFEMLQANDNVTFASVYYFKKIFSKVYFILGHMGLEASFPDIF